jgi:nucleotide-binding universal stress UspA family protein
MTTSTPESQHASGSSPPLTARIAVGIDGFPEGRDAAALGQLLAEATGAKLMLVAVHSAALLPAPPSLSYRTLREQSEQELREIRDSLAPGARTFTATDHSVPRALYHIVERHHRDLLVIGSSRRGPEGHVRIGKRTRQLLCHCECALAVAPRGMRTNSARGLRRIGVGYDGSAESDSAVAFAASIAAGAAADLHVQAVVDDRVPVFARSVLNGLAEVEWDDAIRTEMDEIRTRAVAAGNRTGAQFDVGVARGRPADVLLELSENLDLLVIGSRHWGPAARVLLGSTGEVVMHDAACAVLAVPRP